MKMNVILSLTISDAKPHHIATPAPPQTWRRTRHHLLDDHALQDGVGDELRCGFAGHRRVDVYLPGRDESRMERGGQPHREAGRANWNEYRLTGALHLH